MANHSVSRDGCVKEPQYCELYESDGAQFCYFCFFNYGVLMTILVWAGILGNSLSVTIFLRPRLWVSFNYYLICLALWDSALLISSFLQFSLWVLQDPNGQLNTAGPHAQILRIAFLSINTSLTGCVWIVTCVTVERYMAISCPLRHRLLNNVARAKISLTGVSFLALLFNVPRYFEMDVVEICAKDCVNGTDIDMVKSVMRPSSLVDNLLYYTVYRVVGCCGFVYLIPCSILGILTLRMCLAIHRATKERKRIAQEGSCKEPSTRRVDNNTNRTLALILVKFLTCYSLTTILDVLQISLSSEVFYSSPLIEALAIISNQLVVLNSSTNFLIYYFGGKKFRLEFHNLFSGLRRTGSNATLMSTKSRLSCNSKCSSSATKQDGQQVEVKLICSSKRPLKFYTSVDQETYSIN